MGTVYWREYFPVMWDSTEYGVLNVCLLPMSMRVMSMGMSMSPWYYIYVLTQWQVLFPNLIHHISLSVYTTQEAILTMTGAWSGTKTRQTMNLSSPICSSSGFCLSGWVQCTHFGWTWYLRGTRRGRRGYPFCTYHPTKRNPWVSTDLIKDNTVVVEVAYINFIRCLVQYHTWLHACRFCRVDCKSGTFCVKTSLWSRIPRFSELERDYACQENVEYEQLAAFIATTCT